MSRLQRLAMIAAWCGCAGLLVASWTPGTAMVRTGADGWLEHVIAYGLVASAFVLGYPRWQPWAIVGALAVYGGILEAGQSIVPGRRAGLPDWLFSVGGACIAFLVSAIRRGLGKTLEQHHEQAGRQQCD